VTSPADTPADTPGDAYRLVVMRHAKAEPFAATDHERHLTGRGRREAGTTGRRLADLGVVPDHVVVSTAQRAVETWQAVADGLTSAVTDPMTGPMTGPTTGPMTSTGASTVAPVYEEAVYRGEPEELLECLRAVPHEARTVVLVGHNPSAAHLVHLLSDDEGEPSAVTEMLRGFPPGAAAVLEVPGPWDQVAAATGRLVEFHTPE